MAESISRTSSSETFPTQAQVVIIGGGVIGCSVAYHLTKLGLLNCAIQRISSTGFIQKLTAIKGYLIFLWRHKCI